MLIRLSSAIVGIASIPLLFWLGCGGSSSTPPPAVTPASSPSASPSPLPTPSNVGAWSQVTENLSCEAEPAYACSGAYGFTIFNDGRWLAGPSPSGQTVAGQLSSAELSTIQGDIEQFSGQDLIAPLSCTQSHPIAGIQDRLQIWYGDTPYLMYQYALDGAANCYSGNPGAVELLQGDVKALLEQDYPLPFPGASPTPAHATR